MSEGVGTLRLRELIGQAPSEIDWKLYLPKLREERQRIGRELDAIASAPWGRAKAAKASRGATRVSEPKVRKLTTEEKLLDAKLQQLGLSLEKLAALSKGEGEE